MARNKCFQDLKSQGHQLSAFKPTSVHWTSFANAVIKNQVFNEMLQLAAQQALWQFANALPLINIDDSTQSAKENSVFSLIYINLVRIVLGQMVQGTDKPLLSLEFLTKLAKIEDSTEMERFVNEEFIPLVRSPKTLGIELPGFSHVYDAASQLVKYLYKRNVSILNNSQNYYELNSSQLTWIKV